MRIQKWWAQQDSNLLGMTVWSDTYARVLPHYYPDPPLWQTALPAWLPLGGIKAVGIYTVDGWKPVEVLVTLVSAFGILPVILWKWLKTRTKADMRGWLFEEKLPCSVAVAFLAGAVFFMLAPFSGRSIPRLIGYAWPLFWMALPWLWRSDKAGCPAFFGKAWFWVIHFACMWFPVLLSRVQLSRAVVCLLGIMGVMACYGYAWKRGCNDKRAARQSRDGIA